ncbi:ATP-dependent DNA ligase [Mycobacterium tuberculosis T92]|nr:ATP-dependent DNA ligase [Mycobacterium tuberculosis T92]
MSTPPSLRSALYRAKGLRRSARHSLRNCSPPQPKLSKPFCCDCSAVNCARAQRAGSWPMRSPRPPGSRPRRSNAPRC